MLFKNAFIYRFTKSVPWSASELQTALEAQAFTPCGANESFRLGWIAPAPMVSDELIYNQGRYVLLTLNKEEKILPASVINEELNKRMKVIEEKEQRKLRRNEKLELKEQITAVLLPKAFTRNKPVNAYIDMNKGLLVVDTSSPTKADEFTSTLRQSVGSLPIRFMVLQDSPAIHFSDWVKNDQYPAPFSSGDQCDLRADDGTDTVIRCKGTESLHEAVATHIESGMQVTQIALNWDEKISFLLSDEIIIKRLRYLDTFHDKAAESGTDATEQFAADFSLLTLSFDVMIEAMINALGGEDNSAVVGGSVLNENQVVNGEY